jgi:hypothetical protein
MVIPRPGADYVASGHKGGSLIAGATSETVQIFILRFLSSFFISRIKTFSLWPSPLRLLPPLSLPMRICINFFHFSRGGEGDNSTTKNHLEFSYTNRETSVVDQIFRLLTQLSG